MEGNLLGHTSSAATITSTWHYLLPDTLLSRTILFQVPRDCINRLLQLGCPCCWPLVDLYVWTAEWPSPEVTLSLCASRSTLASALVTWKPMSPFLFCFFYIHRNLHDFFFPFILISWRPVTHNIVVVSAIHWYESAMDLHVFPIPIPPPASFSIPSLWVFPVHQPWALVSCIQPGLVICDVPSFIGLSPAIASLSSLGSV